MKASYLLCLALFCGLVSAIPAVGATRYVNVNNPSPQAPYTNWATAATIIHAAVIVSIAGDEIIVTNGVYATGGQTIGKNPLRNRVALTKPLTLRSVNGPEFTIIRGRQAPSTTNGVEAIRCVYLASGASLIGFTLSSGGTRSWMAPKTTTTTPIQAAEFGVNQKLQSFPTAFWPPIPLKWKAAERIPVHSTTAL